MENQLVNDLERFRNSDSITAEEMLTYLSLSFKLQPGAFEQKKKARRGRRAKEDTAEQEKKNEPTP